MDHAPHVHPTDCVPQVVYGGHVPPHHGFPHVPALDGPHQGFPGASLVSLAHEDLHSSLALDVTMSLSIASRAVPPHLAHMTGTPGIAPPVAPLSSLLVHQYDPVPLVNPPVIPPPVMAPPPAAPAPRSFEQLKLCALKDDKAFNDNYDLIQYYLCVPEFSTGWADDALITDSSNLDASRMWEGQLCMAVKDGSLQYLFENKGDLYNGRGFEMLAALMQHCRPDSVANAFISLLSLFNYVQGSNKPILQYHSRFDGIVMELSRCKVTIPQILMVMLFLRAIHSRYSDLLEQFCTRFRCLKTATLDSIVNDIKFHNGFTIHECKGGAKPPVPCAAAAAAGANSDQKGKVWRTPFEWLSKTKKEVITGCWTRALAGTGICPICHCEAKPWHVPTLCPLLKELNLKLDVLPGLSPWVPSPASAPDPLPSSRVATTDESVAGGSSALGSTSAPLG